MPCPQSTSPRPGALRESTSEANSGMRFSSSAVLVLAEAERARREQLAESIGLRVDRGGVEVPHDHDRRDVNLETGDRSFEGVDHPRWCAVLHHHDRAQALHVSPVRRDARGFQHALDLVDLDGSVGIEEPDRPPASEDLS